MAQHQHVLCGGAAGGATSEIEMIDQGYSARREKESLILCDATEPGAPHTGYGVCSKRKLLQEGET